MCSPTVGVQMQRHQTRRSCSLVEAVLRREPLPAEKVFSPKGGVGITKGVLSRKPFELLRVSPRKGSQEKDRAAPLTGRLSPTLKKFFSRSALVS